VEELAGIGQEGAVPAGGGGGGGGDDDVISRLPSYLLEAMPDDFRANYANMTSVSRVSAVSWRPILSFLVWWALLSYFLGSLFGVLTAKDKDTDAASVFGDVPAPGDLMKSGGARVPDVPKSAPSGPKKKKKNKLV